MSGSLQDLVEGAVDGAPFRAQLPQDAYPFRGQLVETLLALVLLTPLAGEEPLGLEAPEQGIEGALVDGQAVVGEGLAQGVAVLLAPEFGQHCQDQRTPAQLQPQVFEGFSSHGITMRNIVCTI